MLVQLLQELPKMPPTKPLDSTEEWLCMRQSVSAYIRRPSPRPWRTQKQSLELPSPPIFPSAIEWSGVGGPPPQRSTLEQNVRGRGIPVFPERNEKRERRETRMLTRPLSYSNRFVVVAAGKSPWPWAPSASAIDFCSDYC